MQKLLLTIKQNTTKYINGIIDTSKYFTAKKIFLQEISLLNMSKTYWGVCSEKPSEKILGNKLIDLERSSKIGNLKGAIKATLLNNGYSHHSHYDKVTKLKQSRIKKRTSGLIITEECCSPPTRKVTRSMVPLYDRNKCIICQELSKETLFKGSSDLRNEQIKNAFRIATRSLSTVKIRFDHALDASAGK